MSLPSGHGRELRVRVGATTGSPHLLKQVNRQDFALSIEVPLAKKRYRIGFLADGCSGANPKSSHTEVVAKLLCRKALNETRVLLLAGVPLAELNMPLYQRCAEFVRTLGQLTYAGLTGEPEFGSFVGDYLLCTLLGFVCDGEELLSLRSGDGVEIENDKVEIVHEDAPLYLGYHALTPALLDEIIRRSGRPLALPQKFDSKLRPLAGISRFAIASDGLTKRKDGTTYVDPEDIDGIFNYQPHAAAGLQWYLNTRARRESFDDDCAVITLSEHPR